MSRKNRILILLALISSNALANTPVFDEPFLFEGKFYTSVFDNCCFKGESKKTTYGYIELKNPLSIASSMDKSRFKFNRVQIEYNKSLSQILEGTPIKLYCRELWEGMTGHYALPVYCKDPKITILNR